MEQAATNDKATSRLPYRTSPKVPLASVAFPHPVCGFKLFNYRLDMRPTDLIPVLLITFTPSGVNAHYMEVSILLSTKRPFGHIDKTLARMLGKNIMGSVPELSVDEAIEQYGSVEIACEEGNNVRVYPHNVDYVLNALSFVSRKYTGRIYTLPGGKRVQLAYNTIRLDSGLYEIKPVAAEIEHSATESLGDILHTQLSSAALAQFSDLNWQASKSLELLAAKLQGMGIPIEISMETAEALISASNPYYRPVVTLVHEDEE